MRPCSSPSGPAKAGLGREQCEDRAHPTFGDDRGRSGLPPRHPSRTCTRTANTPTALQPVRGTTWQAGGCEQSPSCPRFPLQARSFPTGAWFCTVTLCAAGEKRELSQKPVMKTHWSHNPSTGRAAPSRTLAAANTGPVAGIPSAPAAGQARARPLGKL